MKSTILAAILLTTSASVGLAGETTTLGESLTPDLAITSIETIVADPDAWEGQRVQIEGEVTGVCTKQGCWMDLTSVADVTLRVKVDDGVIVFPQDAVGRQAIAEGKVEIVDLDRDKYEAWLMHVAEEENREFDPAEVGEAPYRLIRLRGLGSEIQSP